jgi:carbamoyl-phosphate synthase large subunit
MKKKKILFTGGGGAGNEALWRLLSQKYDLYFVDADIAHIDPQIPESNKFQIPLASSESFIRAINNLCKELNIDLLVPSVDEELTLLSYNASRQKNFKIMLPQQSYVTTMLDKFSMVRALQDNNLIVPETETLSKHQDISGFSYPCIIKPRKGRGSRGVFSAKNREEVELFKDKLGDSCETHIIQQQKFGYEYTVQMIANSESQLIHVVPIKVFSKKGITIRAEIDNNDAVIKACKLVHKSIPCRGTYNIQLILTDAGEVYPFEINPRISTTFCLVVAAGIDPIDIYINGSDAKFVDDFESKKVLSRHWQNHFS